ncbi:MAG: helix-turn-helix transcriptional regulator [Chloroflexota bacterium]|nr:MAG: helix-turn-helix transcriptional regulator [Chloroflexota bacterium]
MTEGLLQTKLFIPPVRPNLVPRPRLIERLNQGLQLGHRLSLISAPAGFGKTTLAAEWLSGLTQTDAITRSPAHPHTPTPLHPNTRSHTAWLSLDERDNDLTRFLAYFVAALQTIKAGIGEGVLGMVQSPQPPPTDSVLTALLNDIVAIPEDFVLVLDDYHLIESRPVGASTSGDTLSNVDETLAFLLEHQPPRMHLVIATREDPNLPLARLRVRGQLTELRAADLRFTSAEAAGFLNRAMGLDLSAEEIAALETRTEGWIAGLQMAALSMQGRDDTAAFIQAFAGSHHFVFDYLVGEVLGRQPEHVRSFLLQTSILDRLSGPLCDAVRFGFAKSVSSSSRTALAGQQDGAGTLGALERDNLFVVPLDDKRQWYRYHHLFADVLQARLLEEMPDQVSTLHGRASEWYEQNGSPADSIRHALAARDFERAAGLVELAWPEMDWSFQSDAWLGWVKALPDDLVRARPVLSVGYAWALLNIGQLEAGEARLRDAERWLEATEDMAERPEARPAGMIVVDEEQFRSLPASIASAHVYYAQALGDAAGTVMYARQALDLLPEGDHQERGRVAVLLGLAYWARGSLEEAHQSFADAMADFQLAGNIVYAISFTFILADIRLVQGRLREAISTYERSLRLAADQGEPELQGAAYQYLGLSELHRELGDLDAARQYMLRSEELGDQSEVYRYRWCRAQAQITTAQGDLDDALNLLDEAERSFDYRNPIPDVRPTAALKTRVWIAQGRLTEAMGWAHERGLSVDEDLSYLREFEHATLARLLIAQYRSERIERAIHDGIGLLERLLKAAEEGGRIGSFIEILLLQALAYHALSDIPRALDALERALTLAEPEGYVQIFVEEGQPMVELLRKMKSEAEGMKEYAQKLLDAYAKQKEIHPSSFIPHPSLDPLSQRELEVLRLLETELTGPEIARELTISLNTMRTHTKNIYGKLGVNNRRAAVRRAVELRLL